MNTKTTPMTALSILQKHAGQYFGDSNYGESFSLGAVEIIPAMEEYANQFKPKEATDDQVLVTKEMIKKTLYDCAKIIHEMTGVKMERIFETEADAILKLFGQQTIKSSDNKTARQIMEENFKGLVDVIKDKDLLYFYRELIVTCIECGKSSEVEAVGFGLWLAKNEINFEKCPEDMIDGFYTEFKAGDKEELKKNDKTD